MEDFRALLAGLLLFPWCGLSTVSGDSLKLCEFPAIYNFGDSNSATGGFGKSALEPPNAPNRICDGRLIIDFIVEYLKLPELSAYEKSLEANFRHGANFAIPGSTIGKTNRTSRFIAKQVERFNQFKLQTKELSNEAKNDLNIDKLPRQEDFAKALYMFDIGQNDFESLFSIRSDQLHPTIVDIVDQLASSVQSIYQQGGRAFWIHNTGPIGCLPQYVIKNRNSTLDEQGCVKSYNDMAMDFNKQLKETVVKLRSKLPEAAITYVDIYVAKYELIRNAKKLGFDDPFKFCCGNKENPKLKTCRVDKTNNNNEMDGVICKDPSKFISWDSIHYTQAANQLVANQILNGSLTDPPITIAQSCQRQ